MLHCADCHRPHDLDESPDTGECVHCQGPLIQDGEERPDITRALAEALTESLAEKAPGFFAQDGKASN